MAYLDDDGNPTVIKMGNDDRTMPSVVAFTKIGRVVGKRAKTDVRTALAPVLLIRAPCPRHAEKSAAAKVSETGASRQT